MLVDGTELEVWMIKVCGELGQVEVVVGFEPDDGDAGVGKLGSKASKILVDEGTVPLSFEHKYHLAQRSPTGKVQAVGPLETMVENDALRGVGESEWSQPDDGDPVLETRRKDGGKGMDGVQGRQVGHLDMRRLGEMGQDKEGLGTRECRQVVKLGRREEAMDAEVGAAVANRLGLWSVRRGEGDAHRTIAPWGEQVAELKRPGPSTVVVQ
jgi:hypothetical protein